ncbi:hypothetical protein WJX73_005832 [Symbiochloris irregularis]|uniref:peptidyl-tRNA hydrolase n=1 Tax=Symbiochloris irregularis TaxID=706552 RepID=A0AAW1NNH4_9CHLO
MSSGESTFPQLHLNINQHTAAAIAVAAAASFALGYWIGSPRISSSNSARPPASALPRSLRPSESFGTFTPRSPAPSEPCTPRGSVNGDISGEFMKLAIVVNKSLDMGPAKIAQHCAHATLAQFKKLHKKRDPGLRRWEMAQAPKVIVGADDEEAMQELRNQARNQELSSFMVQDGNGSNDLTVLAIGPGDGNAIDRVVGHLKLL